ncbi:unnamed protein product, partial [Larinioides sclopetarius]
LFPRRNPRKSCENSVLEPAWLAERCFLNGQRRHSRIRETMAFADRSSGSGEQVGEEHGQGESFNCEINRPGSPENP